MILSFFRTLILYLVLIAVMRILGKRQIGQLEPSEFVVAMLIADLASIPMQDNGIPLSSGLVPILTVLGLELALSGLTMISIRCRRLLCGKPVILIENGRLLQENLRAARISLDELSGQLRGKDVLDLAQVQFAILETNGSLSVFPYPEELPPSAREAGTPVAPRYLPYTIIQDGCLIEENLRKSGRDRKWLQNVLKKKKAGIGDTFLLTVDKGGQINWVGRENVS